MQLSRRLDWVLKLWIINRYRQGQNCTWGHPLLSVLDLQYHNIDDEEGVFYRTQDQDFTERFLTDNEIVGFVHAAPDVLVPAAAEGHAAVLGGPSGMFALHARPQTRFLNISVVDKNAALVVPAIVVVVGSEDHVPLPYQTE